MKKGNLGRTIYESLVFFVTVLFLLSTLVFFISIKLNPLFLVVLGLSVPVLAFLFLKKKDITKVFVISFVSLNVLNILFFLIRNQGIGYISVGPSMGGAVAVGFAVMFLAIFATFLATVNGVQVYIYKKNILILVLAILLPMYFGFLAIS